MAATPNMSYLRGRMLERSETQQILSIKNGVHLELSLMVEPFHRVSSSFLRPKKIEFSRHQTTPSRPTWLASVRELI